MRNESTPLAVTFSLLAALSYAFLAYLIQTAEHFLPNSVLVFFRQLFGLLILLPIIAAEPPAERRARLTAELAAARAELTAARRAAIVMPDGRTYARRTAAEARVKALEAELAAD